MKKNNKPQKKEKLAKNKEKQKQKKQKKAKSNLVIIGKAKFSQNISAPMRHFFYNKLIFLSGRSWVFNQHDYLMFGQSLFLQMVQCGINYIYCRDVAQLQGQIPNIIHVRFERLNSINMTGCDITSIEFIQFFNSPKIAKLNFNCNLISNLKTLNKTNFSKLTNLSFIANILHQVDISRTKMKYQIKGIFLQQILRFGRTTKVTENDISKFMKIQAKYAQYFFHSSCQRIFQKKVDKMSNFPKYQFVRSTFYQQTFFLIWQRQSDYDDNDNYDYDYDNEY